MLKPLVVALLISFSSRLEASPPFHGTIFVDPNIITSDDASSFSSLEYVGRENRLMFDRRRDGWVNRRAFLFIAKYQDGLSIEIQVNPEFKNIESASALAEKYAPIIGRLPHCLREHVQTVWIHRGNKPFGGGNNNLLIHTEQADQYESSGILEETLVHEASHTSLDAVHAESTGWLRAQKTDPAFISDYARENPKREDIAESFLLYLAVRYRSQRIPEMLKEKISQTIPNRIAYFDDQKLNLHPFAVNLAASHAQVYLEE